MLLTQARKYTMILVTEKKTHKTEKVLLGSYLDPSIAKSLLCAQDYIQKKHLFQPF